jgi:hypothetical protein
MPTDIKPIALSLAQAAKAWSVSRGTAYAIIRHNPWIRVIKIHGSKRAIPYEDVIGYVNRCAVVGVGANESSKKIKSIKAAAAANRKLAKTTKRTKSPAASAEPSQQHAESASTASF